MFISYRLLSRTILLLQIGAMTAARKPHILVIDDDEKLTRLLVRYLDDYGFTTSAANHPREGLTVLKKKDIDLVVLDIMLPEMDGFEVCKVIRKTSQVPIIMLTARGDITDRVVGLELGSDDYLSKPFEPRELVARIGSILRRAKATMKPSQVFGSLKVDHKRRRAEIAGNDTGLTTGEFTVLSLLVSEPGKVYNRDEILQSLSGIDSDAFNRTVDITVSRLRQKLGDDPKNPQFIRTIWGAGYAFIGESNDD